MASHHTPGPWKWQPSTKTIRSVPANYWLASLDSWDGVVKPDNDANGKLMAAAPDLLNALEALLEDVNLKVPAEDMDEALSINICLSNAALAAAGRPSTPCGEDDCGICQKCPSVKYK